MSTSGLAPVEDLPPTRKRITAALLLQGFKRPEVEEMLNAFAHELAERIRAEKGSGTYEPGVYFRSGMDYAADLIDSAVSAGPVRPDEEPTT